VSIGSLRTVYGTLLNFRAEFEAWAPKMAEPPYKAPPKAPVLYIKPANTWSANGATIALPARVTQVDIGATIAMLMKAPGEVAGYLLMNDLSIPHTSLFRPPVKFKCLDGFLGIGDTLLPAGGGVDPARLRIEVRVNGELKQSIDFARLVRPAVQLLADVGEFMTLGAGDVLMLGVDAGRPLAKAGDRVEISGLGLGTLSNTLVPKAAP
jgi:5-oxopent-3-ene-1,2,5-tricarboxylate decarboxylase / 2-hydroxyhepta-2,4-diene-1,7-dioate isomerase